MIHVCPPPPKDTLPLDTVLAVGFGSVEVRKGNKVVWIGDDEGVTLKGFDAAASILTEDGVPWRVIFNGPLSGATYKRVGQDDFGHGYWELEATNAGFA